MICPFCQKAKPRVIHSVPIDHGRGIRRRRMCLHCRKRFTTYERLPLAVGVRELPFPITLKPRK